MKHENIRMTLLALAVAVAVAGSARAATETVGGVAWSYDVDAGEAAVTGAEPAAGELTIPSILGGCPVTRIGDNAFASCEGLTGVTIPSSVKRIGKSAFSGCSTLTSVALPEGLKRIESGAFFLTGLETVTVPKSVRWIGGTAFAFTPLQSATVLGGAISGNDGAFVGCSSLKTLTLGTRVSGISYYAFANYASRQVSLETVHAPASWEGKTCPLSGGFFGVDFTVVYDNGVDDGEPVEEEEEYEDVWDYQVVDGGAVLGMWSEVGGKVVIPSTLGGYPVTAIADFAFYYAENVFASLRIPDSVTSVGTRAFMNCNALTALYVPASWEGTDMLANAGVPEGCTVVYGTAPAGERTSTGVPYAWLEENAADILAANGGDHEAAAKAPAANGRPVWECYVAGLSPTDPAADFKITSIAIVEGGGLAMEWEPDLGEDHTYVMEGKAAMADEWGPGDASSRFFRVKVVRGQGTPEPPSTGVQLWKDGPYWAERNIGAKEPWEYGYYFWWGDTVGYKCERNVWVASDGSAENYSFDSTNTPTRNKDISTLQSEGWIDAGGNLAPEHDAAHVHWGGGWRMPTDEEFADLIRNTTTTWTTSNGVYGRLLTGKGDYASASIFLPAAGLGYETGRYNCSGGDYWSSTPSSSYSDYARGLGFNSGNFFQFTGQRERGYSVRALLEFAE